MYEDNACNLDDLDGRHLDNLTLEPDETGTLSFSLVNTGDWSGGDYADITLVLENQDTP